MKKALIQHIMKKMNCSKEKAVQYLNKVIANKRKEREVKR